MSELAEPLYRESSSSGTPLNFIGGEQSVFRGGGIVGREERIHPGRLCVLSHTGQAEKHVSQNEGDGAIVEGVAEPKNIVRGLIQQMLAVSGWTLTRLARQANLSPSTLTKFVNDQSDDIPSTRTLIKL